MAQLANHQHGKSKVRLGRTWRNGDKHFFVEWSVSTMLESDMAHAFLQGSNADMTATDTQKNLVYYVAKQCATPCTPEQYGLELARVFIREYPKVFKAKVWIEAKPWRRIDMDGRAHNHGFSMSGDYLRTCYVSLTRDGEVETIAGLKNWMLLKTTQSGYEGFLHDRFTRLPDVNDRIVASSVTATWKYSKVPPNYDEAFKQVEDALRDQFFGPPDKGVYSPSVQYTLFQMGKAAIDRVPEVESVFLNMPNLHFNPCQPVESKFEDDVYVATSEPHGNIEATITRGFISPHAKL
eukprot:jgi/Botrbrau1/16819/Bobra.150_2s0046.1